jgi:hypothetical protein
MGGGVVIAIEIDKSSGTPTMPDTPRTQFKGLHSGDRSRRMPSVGPSNRQPRSTAGTDPAGRTTDRTGPRRSGLPRLDATGSRRRLQALAAIGWSCRQLSAELGSTGDVLFKLVSGRTTTVNARTARRVAELYDRLSMTPGPSLQVAERALKAGWPPPLAWDDELLDDPASLACQDPGEIESIQDWVKVFRACEGEKLSLTTDELQQAIRVLHGQGLTDPEIAQRLVISSRTVLRHRGKLVLAANAPSIGTRARPDR